MGLAYVIRLILILHFTEFHACIEVNRSFNTPLYMEIWENMREIGLHDESEECICPRLPDDRKESDAC